MCGVELVPVERLKPAGYNPRRADAERLALVRLSLSRLGFLLPIVATPDGEILPVTNAMPWPYPWGRVRFP